jgi:energy-coupling factor transport system ATP-binding protein
MYGELAALRGVSLSLREGEVVALVGANGSGKSTLFRAIAGVVAGTGRVELDGRPAAPRVQDRTAFAALLPQDPAMALYRETVALEIEGSLRARASARTTEEVLREWRLEGIAGRNPRDLSVGQQQRVATAAMLAHEPRVWLLDEPTRGADEAAKTWLAERLHTHAESGGAAIVASHDVESAARWATRVVGLAEGRVAFDLPVRAAFGQDGPLPTQTARLVAGAILPEEVER